MCISAGAAEELNGSCGSAVFLYGDLLVISFGQLVLGWPVYIRILRVNSWGSKAGFSLFSTSKERVLWRKQACNFTNDLFCVDHYPNGIFHPFGLDILFFGIDDTIWNISLYSRAENLFSGHCLPWNLTKLRVLSDCFSPVSISFLRLDDVLAVLFQPPKQLRQVKYLMNESFWHHREFHIWKDKQQDQISNAYHCQWLKRKP